VSLDAAAVIVACIMGAVIAAAYLRSGCSATLVEISPESLAAAVGVLKLTCIWVDSTSSLPRMTFRGAVKPRTCWSSSMSNSKTTPEELQEGRIDAVALHL
jgi:hypothetical protein